MMLSKYFRLLCILAALVTAASCARTKDPPNIVFILADDMGYSDLGSYGAEVILTPNIDELAMNGLRYTNFYNTGRCWPTRTCLLSGYYPHQVLSDPMQGVDYRSGSFQPVNETWLPALLREHGYHSYHSGKWHILRRVPGYYEYSHAEVGFEHSYQTQDGRHLRPLVLTEDGDTMQLPAPGSGYEASTDIVDHAIKYIRAHSEKYEDDPFFSYIAFIAPHFPLQALQEDIDAYREKFIAGWNEFREMRAENMKELGFEVKTVSGFEPDRFAPWNLSPEELITQIDSAEVGRAVPWNSLSEEQQQFQATKMAIHAAMVTRMDREVGRFISELKELGYFENTIIFFCSDNGASLEMMNRADKHTPGSLPGSAASYICLGPGWSTASNTPFRLHKTWLHEGGISTPLVVRWPEGIRAKGALRNMPSHMVDIAPTILQLAGGNPEELNGNRSAPGISLVPTLEADVQLPRPPLFFHHEGKNAIRDGDWKAVTIAGGEDWELYDLSADRGETRDMALENPQKLDEMVRLWTSQRDSILKQITH